jgi:ribosomal protein S18 acetylase RimI-like enzyme
MRPPRPARPDEAPALAALAEETFRATFGAANTRADLDLHCARAYGPAQQAAELADPALLTLVVTEGEALVAYAQLRLGSAAPACVRGARPAELCRLYALPALHGRGAGPALLTAALDAAAARGAGVVWLGVWEHNPRACHVYARAGFVEVGAHTFLLGTDPQRDLILQRPGPAEQTPGAPKPPA